MRDVLQHMEDNSRKISRLAQQTLQLLISVSPNESPAKYQSVIRNAGILKAIWTQQIQLANTHLAQVIAPDLYVSDFSDRRKEENVAVECMLERLASAVWPRSPQCGLESIRVSAIETLTLLLNRVEREQAVFFFTSQHELRHSELISN